MPIRDTYRDLTLSIPQPDDLLVVSANIDVTSCIMFSPDVPLGPFNFVREDLCFLVDGVLTTELCAALDVKDVQLVQTLDKAWFQTFWFPTLVISGCANRTPLWPSWFGPAFNNDIGNVSGITWEKDFGSETTRLFWLYRKLGQLSERSWKPNHTKQSFPSQTSQKQVKNGMSSFGHCRNQHWQHFGVIIDMNHLCQTLHFVPLEEHPAMLSMGPWREPF